MTLNNDARCAFTTRAGLFALLRRVRALYATRSDTEVTAEIRAMCGVWR